MTRRERRRQKSNSRDDGSVAAPIPLPTSHFASESCTGLDADINQQQRNADDQLYSSYRDQLQSREWDSAKEYDKWILTVSGVLLGFSLALVKDLIRPSGVPIRMPWVLWSAWAGLGLPLMLSLVNLHLTYSATKKYREILDELYEKYDETPNFWAAYKVRMACVKRTAFVERFNEVGLVSFLIGVIALAAFVGFNIADYNFVDSPSKIVSTSKPT